MSENIIAKYRDPNWDVVLFHAKTRGGIRAARVEKSPRLCRILAALALNPKGRTTRQLIEDTGSCAISSAITDLRANGFSIKTTRKGNNVYHYQLLLPDGSPAPSEPCRKCGGRGKVYYAGRLIHGGAEPGHEEPCPVCRGEGQL